MTSNKKQLTINGINAGTGSSADLLAGLISKAGSPPDWAKQELAKFGVTEQDIKTSEKRAKVLNPATPNPQKR